MTVVPFFKKLVSPLLDAGKVRTFPLRLPLFSARGFMNLTLIALMVFSFSTLNVSCKTEKEAPQTTPEQQDTKPKTAAQKRLEKEMTDSLGLGRTHTGREKK